MAMLTFLFVIVMLIFFGKGLALMFKASWGLMKILFGIFFLPAILIGMVIVGLIQIALLLLVIALIIRMVRSSRASY